MVAGFQSFTDTGILQVDHTAYCLVQRSTGTISSWTQDTYGSAGNVRYADLVVTNASDPMVSLVIPYSADPLNSNQASIVGGVVSVSGSGSTKTFKLCIAGSGALGTAQAVETIPITYYVYDRPLSQSSGVGIEVFDASGNCTFSSLATLMKSVEVWNPWNPTTTFDVNKTYSAVVTATALSTASYATDQDNQQTTTQEQWVWGAYSTAHGVSGEWIKVLEHTYIGYDPAIEPSGSIFVQSTSNDGTVLGIER